MIGEDMMLMAMRHGITLSNKIALTDGRGRTIWETDVGDMVMECACTILNGMILFSVTHPREDERTVFVIERGPEVRTAFHLDVKHDGRIVKRIAYERGLVVMVVGPRRDRREMTEGYDAVVVLDTLHGAYKEWTIDAMSTQSLSDVTQARGLEFLIGINHFRVVAA